MLNDIAEQFRMNRENLTRDMSLQVLRKFEASLEGMPIPHESLRGNILIAGVGRLMPEKVWLCTSESDYKELREEIDRLVITDSRREIETPLLPKSSLEKVESYSMEVGSLLSSMPSEQFDAITFMRIADFANQLHMGTLESFAKALKPGGVFIGSGSTVLMWNNFYYTEETFQYVGEDLGLELVAFNRLEDIDCSGFLYQSNAGVVYRKVSPTP